MSEPIQSIAQNNYILATQQEVSHDTSLSGNGTVDSPLGVVPGYNETVLWSGNGVNSFTTTEPLTNFERVKFYLNSDANAEISCVELPMIGRNTSNVELAWSDNWRGAGNGWRFLTWYSYLNNTGMSAFNVQGSYYLGINDSNNSPAGGSYGNSAPLFYKVVGINRIANN